MIDAHAIAAAQYFVARYGARALMLTRNIADAHRSTANEHAPFWSQVALMAAAILEVANSPQRQEAPARGRDPGNVLRPRQRKLPPPQRECAGPR